MFPAAGQLAVELHDAAVESVGGACAVIELVETEVSPRLLRTHRPAAQWQTRRTSMRMKTLGGGPHDAARAPLRHLCSHSCCVSRPRGQALRELGCADLPDLLELEDTDMEEIGMKKMEIKRFKRHFTSSS